MYHSAIVAEKGITSIYIITIVLSLTKVMLPVKLCKLRDLNFSLNTIDLHT